MLTRAQAPAFLAPPQRRAPANRVGALIGPLGDALDVVDETA